MDIANETGNETGKEQTGIGETAKEKETDRGTGIGTGKEIAAKDGTVMKRTTADAMTIVGTRTVRDGTTIGIATEIATGTGAETGTERGGTSDTPTTARDAVFPANRSVPLRHDHPYPALRHLQCRLQPFHGPP